MSKIRLPLGYGRQFIDDADRKAVLDVLDSNFLTQGPSIDAFEQALCNQVGAKYAIVVSNGTAALHLACLVAGLGIGDLAITSSLTFVATANAARYCGAHVDIIDIDKDNLGMSIGVLDTFINKNPETKAILPVHFAGLAGDMEQLRKIAGDRIVIEDACHAIGGKYECGAPIGCSKYSDMTVFSFHPVKTMTTAEGGAITTNNPELARRLRMLRSHGIESNKDLFIGDPNFEVGSWSYEQQELGYNYRLTDIQAALGASQLGKLEQFITRRREIAARYDKKFRKLKNATIFQSSIDQRSRSGLHLYLLGINFEKLQTTREEIKRTLWEKGIGSQVHYIPLYRQPYQQNLNKWEPSDFPNTEVYYQSTLSIPFYPSMNDDEANYVIENIESIIG